MKPTITEIRHNCLNLMATEGREAVEKYLVKEFKYVANYDCVNCNDIVPLIHIDGDVSFCALCGNVVDETEKVSFTENRTPEEKAGSLFKEGTGLDLRGYLTNEICGTRMFKNADFRMRYIKKYGLLIVNPNKNTNGTA